MSGIFSIHESAEIEINEAADFYDIESPGLGTAFINEIGRGIEIITCFPEAAPRNDVIFPAIMIRYGTDYCCFFP